MKQEIIIGLYLFMQIKLHVNKSKRDIRDIYNIICYVINASDAMHDSVGNLSQKRMVKKYSAGFFPLKVKIIAIHRRVIPCYSKIK